ncbi:MAG: hypothetical protein WC711_04120 [Candidatus Staskawiczbacteria bacterium]|jgi:hypothetical protein
MKKGKKQDKIINFLGKEIDEEGYIKSVEFWTKEDGSIRMNIAEGFSWENLIQLCELTIEESKEHIKGTEEEK